MNKSGRWGEHWEKWILFTMRLPPDMKARIELAALEQGESQSEVVRLAIDEFLETHVENPDEAEAAKIATRRRREVLRLAEPKDGHRTEMQIASAWDSIEKAENYFEKKGVLEPYHYDMWIRRLEQNIASVDESNPEKEAAVKTYRSFIEKLRGKKEKLQRTKSRTRVAVSVVSEEREEYKTG